MIVHEFAPAKINLTLEVLGRRADGYHELASLVAFADVGDRLTLDTDSAAGVTLSGPFAASIAGANLISTTLELAATQSPALQLGSVHLEKNLPVAAGIGGGSADAAAVLRALRTTNGTRAAGVDWAALALRLGADVPVCLESRLSLMEGLGERVTPITLATPLTLPAVIVNPLEAVPPDKTAQVFRALGAEPLPATGARPGAVAHLTNLRREDLLARISAASNSLERPARTIVPAIGDVLNALQALEGCRLARMSGGGPTCFALFDDPETAARAAQELARAAPSWWVRATLLR